jgi:hypothetical protein
MFKKKSSKKSLRNQKWYVFNSNISIHFTRVIHFLEKYLRLVYNLKGLNSLINHRSQPAIFTDFKINNITIVLQSNAKFNLEQTTSIKTYRYIEVIKEFLHSLIETPKEVNRYHNFRIEIEGLWQRLIVNFTLSSFVKYNE